MATAVVTGGAGFLGFHLCRILLDRTFDVVVLDDMSTPGCAERARILERSGARVVAHDVRESFPTLPDAATGDLFVYHLACPASPPLYQGDPIKTIETSFLGTRNALEFARSAGASTFLLASTSEVYGDPEVHPQPETYRGNVSCTGPRACYDEGKRAAEALVSDYGRVHGIDVRIARIFNTYGTHMYGDDGRVVSGMVWAAATGRPIVVHGSGSQTRSFCHVSDTVRALYLMATRTGVGPTPINVGNPNEISILRLAEMVRERFDGRPSIVHAPLPVDDPRRRCPDISRALEVLWWRPLVDLERGLDDVVAWMRARAEAESGTTSHRVPSVSEVGR